VKGSYQLGMMPDRNMSVNIVPVDYVSRGIVHLSLLSEAAGETFHLTSPQSTPIHDLVTWASDTGNGLREVSYREWRTALIKQAEGSMENALVPLLPMFPIDRPEQIEQLVDCRRTVDILARAGIYCPPIDARLVSVYTDYLRESGHMTVNV
jgi:thioester reductase-like protein